MQQAVQSKLSETIVKFYAGAWDEAETDANARTLAAMEAYVRGARASGLSDDEIAEDLVAQWGDLGPISVATVVTPGTCTVWIDIGE